MIKRLYSIGDSFMTTDDPTGGIVSFCELYCQHRGFEHVSLARPGATNFSIRLQIDLAIEQGADYAVIGLTSSDRFDIAVGHSEHRTLHNVCYTNYRAASEHHVNQSSVTTVSDTFNNIQEQLHQTLVTPQQIAALKHYIADLHDPSLASQRDYYVVSDGIRKMISAGIDFVLIPGWMAQHDWTWVPRVWPQSCASPYHMPYGPSDWEQPLRFTNTHNPAWAHEEFCATLLSMTSDWQ